MRAAHELVARTRVHASHASCPSNPPRFSCAYPFLSDFRGQFWRSSGTQNGSCGISSESSRRPLSNDIKFARIGVRTRELWLPEVGVSELFSCTLPVKIPDQTGDAIGEPRVPRRSRSHYLSNAPGLADQLVASRKDSAREGGSCAAYFCKVPDSRESELGLVRYGPASRVHRGVFGPFEGSFPIRIPAETPINSWRSESSTSCMDVSSFQCARARRSTCCESGRLFLATTLSFLVRFRPVKYGIEALDILSIPWSRGGQFDPVFGLVNGPVKPWSNLVNLGQTWSNLVKALQTLGKCIPDFISRVSGQGGTLVGLETARSNLGQTSGQTWSTSQTWSTLVKLGQTLGNVSRTFFLGVFDADEPSSDHDRLGSGCPRFACRHPRKSRG
uniref:Uncharacterized protein n=1 Tax=Fagus sylvatica TaxID=28930 RepID=A0A2N9IGB8_FAGSY